MSIEHQTADDLHQRLAELELKLQKMRKAGEDTEARRVAMMESAIDAIIVSDHTGRIQEFNKAAEEMFHYAADEVLGKKMSEVIIPEGLRQAHNDGLARYYRTREPRVLRARIEISARRRDGQEFPVELTVTQVQGEGEPVFVGYIRDITDRKQTEQALSSAREEWEQSFNALPAHIGILDTTGKILRANQSMREQFEPIHGSLEGLDYRLLYFGTATPDPQPPCAAVLNGSDPVALETTLPALPGWFAVSAYPLLDSAGQQWGAVSVVRDLTAHKLAEEERDRFFELSLDMLCVMDLEGRLKRTNPAFEAFLGLSSQGLSSKPVLEFVHGDDREATNSAFAALATGQEVRGLRHRCRCHDGSYRWISWNIPAPAPGQLSVYAVARDVTDEEHREQRLRRAIERAEDASRAKSDFLAVVSHEMRTPLHGMLGNLDLSFDSPMTSDQRERLHACQESAGQLLNLINDILDFSRIETGKFELREEAFEFHDLMEKLVRGFEPKAIQKGLALRSNIDPRIPTMLVGDSSRLRQLLINLIGNALKFTDRGSVVLTADLKSSGQDGCQLHLKVIDTGVGIPRDRQHDIFSRFEQVDNSATRGFGGIGLGLAICSHLVEMMHGQIWVDSNPGKGATFHVLIRLGTQASQSLGHQEQLKEDEQVPAGKPTLTLLLVDDDEISNRVTAGMLGRDGHHVVSVANGRDAVREFSDAAAGHFDLVLMDVMMPGMSGFEATRLIRGIDAERQSTTKIVALTAKAMMGDEEECLRRGMDGYMSKPFKRQELSKLIQRIVGSSHSETSSANRDTSEKLVDWPAFEERCDSNLDLIQDVVRLFATIFAEEGHIIESALEQADHQRAFSAAHKLKGAVGNLCTPTALTRLETFEQNLTDRIDVATATAIWTDLRSLLKQLEQELQTELETQLRQG